MNISCPECSAVFRLSAQVLPREVLGDRPQKMRCCQCKTVFLVSLKVPEPEPEPEPGYEEFSAPESEQGDSDEGHTELTVPQGLDGCLESNTESEQLCVEVFDYRKDPSLKIEVEETGSETSPRLVDDTREWTTENILNLSHFEVRLGVRPRRNKTIWIAAAAFFLFVALFAAFAAYRNNADFGAKSAEAKAASEEEDTADEKSLKVTVERGHKLMASGDNQILVVTGRIESAADEKRTRVLLEGRVIDEAGRTRFKTKGPCGIAYKDGRLRRRKKGTFQRMFKRRGRFSNCKLKPGQSKKYQLIFDDIPKGYDEEYRVEVSVARVKKPKNRRVETAAAKR